MKNIFKVIAGQTSWQLLGKVTTSLSTIVILSLITRKFGEEAERQGLTEEKLMEELEEDKQS